MILLKIWSCTRRPGAHYRPMARTQPSPFGEFQCDQCGSLYEVEFIALSQPASDEAICQSCQMVMNEWRGTRAPVYKLKSPSHQGQGLLKRLTEMPS
ncbi:MAG: hypothetical protein ACLP1D_27785 [Xanthobacteraceae bacterium]